MCFRSTNRPVYVSMNLCFTIDRWQGLPQPNFSFSPTAQWTGPYTYQLSTRASVWSYIVANVYENVGNVI